MPSAKKASMTSATDRVESLLIAPLLSVGFKILWATLGLGGTFTSYGPRVYERGTGNATPVVNSFAIPHPSVAYNLKFYNGGRAVKSLNGAVIVGPQSFNQNVGEVSVQLTHCQRSALRRAGQRYTRVNAVAIRCRLLEDVGGDLLKLSAGVRPHALWPALPTCRDL